MRRMSLLPHRRRAHQPARSDSFRALQREIDQIFDDFGNFPSFGFRTNSREVFDPTVDVSETDHDIQVSAELPGVDEKDVEVTLVGNTLTVKGEKRAEKEEKEKDYHLVERTFGSFQRSIPLDFDADPDAVDAKFAKGVLTVIVPKPAERLQQTKKIAVQGD